MGPFEIMVESQYLTEKVDVIKLTSDFVKKIRSDYYMLMRNFPRVKTQDQLEYLRGGIVRFRDYLSSLFDESEGFGSGSVLKKMKNFCYQRGGPGVSGVDEAASMIRMYVDPVRLTHWDVHINLDVVFEPGERRYSDNNLYANVWDGSEVDGSVLDPRKVKNYRSRLSRHMKKFIDALNDFVEWAETEISVGRPVDENVEMFGFQVTLNGYDPNKEHYRNGPLLKVGFERFREGLRLYARNAQRLYPLLLKKKIPIIVNFEKNLDDGGRYERNSLRLAPMAFGKNPKEITHVIAHEMGHHIYRTVLPGRSHSWWRSLINGDYKEFDLDRLMRIWDQHPNAKFLSSLEDRIRDTDPVLALQIETINRFPRKFGGLDMPSREEMEAFRASGKKLRLPEHPITDYAAKNPEESFCEILGLWIAYGPRAVHNAVLKPFFYLIGV